MGLTLDGEVVPLEEDRGVAVEFGVSHGLDFIMRN